MHTNQQIWTKCNIASLGASTLLVLWYLFEINISGIQLIKDLQFENQTQISYVLVFVILFCLFLTIVEASKRHNIVRQSNVKLFVLGSVAVFSIILAYPKVVEDSVLGNTSRIDLILPLTLSIFASFLASLLNIILVQSLVFFRHRKRLLPGQIVEILVVVGLIVALLYTNTLFHEGEDYPAVLLRNFIFAFFFIFLFVSFSPKEGVFSKEQLQSLEKLSVSLDRQVETSERLRSWGNHKGLFRRNRIHKRIMNWLEANYKKDSNEHTLRFRMLKKVSFKKEGQHFVPGNEEIGNDEFVLQVMLVNNNSGELFRTENVKYKYLKQACKDVPVASESNDFLSFLVPMANKACIYHALNEGEPNELLVEFATSDEHLSQLKELVKIGNPNINYINTDGWTALLIAVANGQEATTKYLLQKAADTSLATKHGAAPLHFASKYGKLSLCRLLISFHADINQQDIWGRTPLMLAAGVGHGAVVQFLIKNGANVDLRSSDNRSAVDYAEQGRFGEIRRSLMKFSNRPIR